MNVIYTKRTKFFYIKKIFSYAKLYFLLFFEVGEVIFQLNFGDICVDVIFFSLSLNKLKNQEYHLEEDL